MEEAYGALTAPIVLVRGDGSIVFVNSACAAKLGEAGAWRGVNEDAMPRSGDAAEWIAKPLTLMLPGAAGEQLQEQVKQASESSSPRSVALTLTNVPSGSLTLKALVRPQGPHLLIELAEDIEATVAARLRSAAASVLTNMHAPLNGVVGLLAALKATEPAGNAERLKSFEQASQYASDAAALAKEHDDATRDEVVTGVSAVLVIDVPNFEPVARSLGAGLGAEVGASRAHVEGVLRATNLQSVSFWGGTGVLHLDAPRVTAIGPLSSVLLAADTIATHAAHTKFPVRCGVALGQVEVSASSGGGLWFCGPAIDTAARVAQSATPPLVLVTEAAVSSAPDGWDFSPHAGVDVAAQEVRVLVCHRAGCPVPEAAHRQTRPMAMPPSRVLQVYQQQVSQLQTAVAHAGTELSLVRAELTARGVDPDAPAVDQVADLKKQLGDTQEELQTVRLMLASCSSADATGLTQTLLATNAKLISDALVKRIMNQSGESMDNAAGEIDAGVNEAVVKELVADVKHLQLDLEYHQQKLDTSNEEKEQLQHLNSALREEISEARRQQEHAEQQLRHQAIDLDMPQMDTVNTQVSGFEEAMTGTIKALRSEVQTKDSALLFCHFELHKEKQVRDKFESRNKRLSDRLEKLMVILEAQRAQMQKLENGLVMSEETLDQKTKILREVTAQSNRLQMQMRPHMGNRTPRSPGPNTLPNVTKASPRVPQGGPTLPMPMADKGTGPRKASKQGGRQAGGGTGGTASHQASIEQHNTSWAPSSEDWGK